MSSNALLWPSQGTKPEERLDKYKWLRLPSQGIGGAPTGTLLLDVFPGAEAAYSLRLLRTAYVGPAIRVVRTSDNAEQDIGFLENGDLDVPELETFVGGSDGLVKIIYDQSNGFDLDGQTDPDHMPKIIIAGTLQITNNRPAMFFDGVDDVLFSSSTITSPADHLFVFMVLEQQDLSDNGGVFNLDSPNTAIARRCFALITNPSGSVLWDAGSLTDRLSATGVGDLIQHQWTLTKTDGTDNQIIKQDGIQLNERTAAVLPTLVENIALGSDSPIGNRNGTMNWQEFVFYDSNQLSNIVGIETDQINYWLLSFFIRITANGDTRITPEADRRIIA